MSRDLEVYIKTSEDVETLRRTIAEVMNVEITVDPEGLNYGTFAVEDKFFWAEIDDGYPLVIRGDDTDLHYEYEILIYPCCYNPYEYDKEYNENVYRGAAQYVFDQLKATGRYSLLIFLDITHVLDRFDLP